MSRNFVGQGKGYWTGNISKKVQQQQNKPEGWRGNWHSIMRLMDEEAKDIRKNVCISCGTATLYDKNGHQYFINARVMDVAAVRSVIASIKQINQQ